MIPRQALFAPTPAGPQLPPPPNFLPTPEDVPPNAPDADTPHASRREHGWSAANQRRFLEAIAEGHGVEAACRHVGLSAASAYAYRRTAKGAAFALGWRAASLVAREAIAETLLVRALEGQVDTYTRADGTQVTRHRHDNRLAMSLLARLDRQVEAAADADVKAARLVAQEFDAYLDLVTRDEGPARAGLFLARRAGALADGADDPADLAPIYALATADRLLRTGHATAAEVPVADLDPHARAQWTAEQWQRAEAAGLLRLALPEPDDDDDDDENDDDDGDARAPDGGSRVSQLPQHSPAMVAFGVSGEPHLFGEGHGDTFVWWSEAADEWRTRFPPPPDFDGEEVNAPDHVEYERSLTDAEAAAMGPGPCHLSPALLARLAAGRDVYFGHAAALRAGDADDLAAAPDWPPPACSPPDQPSRTVSITT